MSDASKLDLKEYTDSYEEALRKMIDQKIKGKDIVETEEEERPARVHKIAARKRAS